MRTPVLAACLVPLGLGLATGSVQAQNIHISPVIGAFHPSSNLEDLRAGGTENLVKDNALALGVNVEASFLRASVAYATSANISEDGVSGGEIGDGSLLAVTGDVVLRPIPRIAGLQPYALGGAGIKHDNYSFSDDGFSGIDDNDNSHFAWHIGLGADLMRGNFGIVAEVSDYITSTPETTLGRHDTFAMVGLRLRAF